MMARVKLESHVSHAVRARWAVPVGASGRDALVRHLVYAFLRSDPEGATDWIDSTVPTDPDELRTMLDFLLTARPPAPLPEDIAADLDTLLEAEAAERGMVDATEIPPLAITDHVPGLLGRNVAFWRGDLTRLRAGAVLNAANSGMLGCFAPGHRCIDNIIHAVAGPALRAECARYMTWAETFDPTRRQGGEPAGRAVFTGGYHLPAQHVIHSVGPVIEDGRKPTLRDRRLLSSCYTSVNWDAISSEAYFRQLIDLGCLLIWYFHYMPVGNDASPSRQPPRRRKSKKPPIEKAPSPGRETVLCACQKPMCAWEGGSAAGAPGRAKFRHRLPGAPECKKAFSSRRRLEKPPPRAPLRGRGFGYRPLSSCTRRRR